MIVVTQPISRKISVFYGAFFAVLLTSFAGIAQTTQTYSTAGAATWTCPSNVTTVTVQCYGAGGSGGGASSSANTAGGGGGGGGYATSVLTVVPNTVYNYSVGTAGSAQAGGSATQANAGTGSWFNTAATVFAGGGTGGFGNTSGGGGAAGAGGTGNIGTTTQVGGAGAAGAGGGGGYGGGGGGGADGTNASPSCDASTSNGGNGGTNGGGYGGSGNTGNGNGNAANAYGGGGGGARRTNGTRSGGAGADGAVVLTYICSTIAGGNYTVGGAGSPNFSSLTAAFTAIGCGGISGNVNLILQSGYTSASETFPLTVPSNAGTYSITIYPAASGLSITSANANETMNFSGSDNIIIDGRVNQAGAMDLIIENTNTSGAAIQFINDATYNTIKYCNVKGVTTSGTIGVINFSTATTTGNDYNTIDHCDVHDGATTPWECIVAIETTGIESDHCTISNCNIYNFYVNGGGAYGVDIENGTSDWTVTGNSFYQTTSRIPTITGTNINPILIFNSTGNGNNYTVTGNSIGGSAANCGGGVFTYGDLTKENIYYGIYIYSGTSNACTVQSNTLTNIAFNTQPNAYIDFEGMRVRAGYVNMSSNVIGGSTGTGSVTINTSTAGSGLNGYGFYCAASQGSLSKNTVGAITLTGGPTGISGFFECIDASGVLSANFSIDNNIVGSTTTANSVQYTTATTTPFSLYGIYAATTGGNSVTISDNTIQNLSHSSTSTSGLQLLSGIYSSSSSTSTFSILRNTIANLSNAKPSTAGLYGIYGGNVTAGQTISNNIIHDINSTASGATTDDVYGIYYAGPTSGTNAIDGNTIYNLTMSSTATASSIYGLAIPSGLATVSNNMITLGNGIATAYNMYGINQGSGTAGNAFYFNSVYIGGTITVTGSSSNCFYSNVTVARTLKNNIFYNARLGLAVIHYAINVSSATGLTSNYNDLYSTTDVGKINNTSYLTFANWKTGSSQDANSLNSDPLFAGPTSTPANLHLSSGSPCGLAGLSGTGITVDIDLEPRSSTPDIGADEYHINYYSKSAGNLELTTSWGANTDGSGANPPNFTTRDCVFNIRNNATPTIGAAWTVSGTGDVVVLGDGTTACNFTIPGSFAFTGTINISNVGTLTNQNTTNPTFNNINTNSTVNYNSANGVAQTVATVAYGNLTLSNSTGSGSSTKSLAATITIAGDLTISRYAVFDISTFNANRTGGGGTLTCDIGSTLKLSGNSGGASTTNNFPNNFSTMTLVSTSTVEYYSATAQNIYPSVTYGNLTTTTGVKTAPSALTIAGNLTINTGSTFSAGANTHTLKGDFLNSGTFTQSTSTMDFNNTSGVLQHIGPAGGTVTTFATLQINNTAGVTMQQDANVSTTLTLSAGLLNTAASGSGLLIMQNGSSAPALTSASTSYVNGPMQYQKTGSGTTTLNFPVGASADCRPFVLTINHSTNTQYNYTAQLFNANPWAAFSSVWPTDMPTTTVDTISGVHYWTIARTDAGGTSQPSAGLGYSAGAYPLIKLYFGTNDGVYQGSGLTIVKNTAATPATWIDIGATCPLGNSASAQAGFVTSTTSGTPFNSFSSFTLGGKNTGWDPLPIELLSFNAVADGNKVDVKWETATETNNAYFTVEKSKDGKNFTKLIDVPGAGNSTSYRNYAETDYQPYEGTSYYRLKQTDANGKYKYFNMVPVTFVKDGQQNIVVFPNPMRENASDLNVKLQGYQSQEVLVVLRNIEGKEFLSKVLLSGDDEHVFIIDNTRALPPGSYIVTASSNDKIYNYKLIVK